MELFQNDFPHLSEQIVKFCLARQNPPTFVSQGTFTVRVYRFRILSTMWDQLQNKTQTRKLMHDAHKKHSPFSISQMSGVELRL